MTAPIAGVSRLQITPDTLRNILQDWWHANTAFPPMQIVGIKTDVFSSGFADVNNVTIELLPVDPLLQRDHSMPDIGSGGVAVPHIHGPGPKTFAMGGGGAQGQNQAGPSQVYRSGP